MDAKIRGLIYLAVFLIIFLIIRSIIRAFKKFIFEVIDRTNNTAPRTNASQTKYTYEARKACEKVTPKRKQDTKPPWEE